MAWSRGERKRKRDLQNRERESERPICIEKEK